MEYDDDAWCTGRLMDGRFWFRLPMAHGVRLVRLGKSGKSKEAPLFRSGRPGIGTMGAREAVTLCAALCGLAPRLRGDGRPLGRAGNRAPGGWIAGSTAQIQSRSGAPFH